MSQRLGGDNPNRAKSRLPPGPSRSCASRQPQGPSSASLHGLQTAFPYLSETARGAAPFEDTTSAQAPGWPVLFVQIVPSDPLLPVGAVCSRPGTHLTTFPQPRRGSRAASEAWWSHRVPAAHWSLGGLFQPGPEAQRSEPYCQGRQRGARCVIR